MGVREELLEWLKERVPTKPVLKESPLPSQVLQIVEFRSTYSGGTQEHRQVTNYIGDATSISSEIKLPGVLESLNPMHKPVLDIDLPVKVVESSTPGHHHLYIDKEMTWEDYELLLKVLTLVGIIEPGYYEASVKRKHTSVRLPWIKKDAPPPKKRPW